MEPAYQPSAPDRLHQMGEEVIQTLTKLATPLSPQPLVPEALVPVNPALAIDAPEPKIGNPECFHGDPTEVLRRLLENSLFVKAEKCEFHVRSVSFLGQIVAEESLQMDPTKVTAVTSWPVPENRKKLQQFLGFANFYRRFIRNYSTVASPFTALPSTKVPFRWTPAADKAFGTLKARFTSAPILQMPDPERQFVVEVDASEVGVGAVLSQCATSDGKLHPCAFYSRRLSAAEQNYDIENRELLA
ncbi:uncharacterized protein LOC130917073 [Corythoichthys intestinalis]|uniref:uncharacterized protein LOC130917073 n=1 Tax=Corythoichthys intestinalis TaxID=161448 RepID=UPI0025A5F407|nr:uncharacterized protein LOC130917073 [Corythoichthys intestinalis]